MISVTARVTDSSGIDALTKLARAAGAFNVRVVVGTPLVYGYGINYGRTRGGRLARAAGPSNFLTGPFEQEIGKIKAEAAKVILTNPEDLPNVLMRGGLNIQRQAQSIVPKVTRALQRSVSTRRI